MYEGGHRRTFLYSYDTALIYPFSIDNADKMRGEAYNIGDNSMNYTKVEIAKLIQEQCPYYLHEASVGTDADQRDYEVSYEKVNKLGYNATVSVQQGIAEMLKVVPHAQFQNPWRNA